VSCVQAPRLLLAAYLCVVNGCCTAERRGLRWRGCCSVWGLSGRASSKSRWPCHLHDNQTQNSPCDCSQPCLVYLAAQC